MNEKVLKTLEYNNIKEDMTLPEISGVEDGKIIVLLERSL